MNRLSAIVLAVGLICGCVSSRYYVPADTSLLHLSKASCTGQTFGSIRLPLSTTRNIEMTLTPTNNTVEVSVRVGLRVGETLRILDPSVRLKSDSSMGQEIIVQLSDWQGVTYGSSVTALYRSEVPIGEPIEVRDPGKYAYETMRHTAYSTQGSAAMKPPERLSVELPALEFNGKRVGPFSFAASRYEETLLSGCIQ
jgi:hypothetical protein